MRTDIYNTSRSEAPGKEHSNQGPEDDLEIGMHPLRAFRHRFSAHTGLHSNLVKTRGLTWLPD